MKFIEKDNYNTCNAIYKNLTDEHEYPNVNLVRLDKWFLKNNGSSKLLDYGCGYGENSVYFAKAGYEVHAADVSKDLISYLKKKNKTKAKQKIKFFHVNEKLKKLPFKDNHFDTIICTGVIMYLASKKKTLYLLNEFERCLKPNGKFIISTLTNFLVINKIFHSLSPLIIFSKHCLDFYLISLIFLVFLSAVTSVYKKYFMQNI